MKRRNTYEGQYYPICNPIDRNLKTNNFCVQANHYSAFNKPFVWDWTDPETNTKYYKVIDKEYILKHCKPCPRFMYDDIVDKYRFIGLNRHCYLISFNDLKKY